MDDDNDKRCKLNKEKIEAFYESKIPVHIACVTNEWHNGNILEIKEKFFLLEERKKGVIPITYQEIYSIDKLDQETKVDDSFIGEGILPEEKKKRGWT
jgi:hypothetical protein